MFRFIILCLSFAISAPSVAQNVLVLDDLQARYDLNSHEAGSGYFVRPNDANEDIQRLISRLHDGLYVPQAQARPNFLQHQRYGLYVPLHNTSDGKDWVIHISAFLIDHVDVYLLDENKQSIVQQSFDFRPQVQLQNQNPMHYKNILGRGIEIELPKQQNVHLYLEFSANSEVPLLYVGLMSSASYAKWIATVESLFFLGLGLTLGFIFTAFTAGFILRDSMLFWFATSSALLVGISFLRSHVGVETIHGSSQGPPDWIPLYLSATLICLLIFVDKFLNLKEDENGWFQTFRWCTYLLCFYAFVSLFMDVSVALIVFTLIGIPSILLVISAGIMKTYKVGKYYFLFMLGWIPVVLYMASNIHFSYGRVDSGEVTLSYGIVEDTYYKNAHIFIHFLAIIIRVLHLKRQKLVAETNSRAKTQFLASLSHDIRQPLHSMRLLIGHLQNEIVSSKGHDILQKISSMQEATSESFNALIDWSKLDAGEVTVCKELVSLKSIFEQLRNEFEPLAQAKSLSLRIRTDDLFLYTDPVLLKRILRNLLSNAIKFTDAGKVILALRRHGSNYHIEVWDSGIGISETEKETVFDVYQRTKRARKKATGIGIGLANVKLLAKELGFIVRVDSIVGKGSRFSIVIPASTASEMHIEQQKTASERTLDLVPLSVVFNQIKDKQLRQRVEKYLLAWGYRRDLESTSDHRQNASNVVLTDTDIENLLNTAKNEEDKMLLGVFSDDTEQELEKVSEGSKYVFRLNPALHPSELRSLLRYADSLNV